MNILQLVVEQMGNEDIRLYKSYVKRSGNDPSRLDLKLFEAYRKGNTDDDEFSQKWYGKEGVGAFHRLKNRVVADINKSELLNLFEEKDTQPFLLYALFKKYYNKNQFELAYRYLLKAEKKAAINEDLRLLDEIYASFLRLVREISAIDPLEISNKIKKNGYVLSYKNRLEELSALVSHRLRSSQNYSQGETNELEKLAELATEGIENWLEKGYHTLSLQILKSACQPLIIQGEYQKVSLFLKDRLDLIVSAEAKNSWIQELRIELLIYFINSLNASGNYSEAVVQAELLKSALQDSSDVLYKKFIYFYYQSLVNAYSELKEPSKSLMILEDMETKQVATLNPMYEVFLWVNTAVCLFDLREYAKSVKTISKLYISPGYKGLDQTLKLKIETAELIIRFERNDLDFAEYKIPRLVKDYQLKNNLNPREFWVIEIISGLSKSPDFRHSEGFRKMVNSLAEIPRDKGQELIDYSSWIENKFKMK